MSLTNFPNGISSMGMPVVGGGMLTTGSIFFVHHTGSNSNSGTDSSHPRATIDSAVGLCTANKGDVIFVMPGHNEAITSATSLVVDVVGISIIGLGEGRNRPILDFDNTAGSIELDVACRFSNIILNASVSAIVVGINVDADDVTIDHCETIWESTGDDFKIIVDVDAFDRCTIVDNKFFGELAVAGGVSSIRIDDSHNLIFQRNLMVGNSAIMFWMEGALSQTCVITDNIMYNADVTDNSCWEISVASTGVFMNNRTGSLFATGVANILDSGSLLCSENYCVNAVLETGIILPTTTPT